MATKVEQWVDIIFVQDWKQFEYDNEEGGNCPQFGEWLAMAEFMTQWDFGDETDGAHTMSGQSHGRDDQLHVFMIDNLEYTLAVHWGLQYASLSRRPLGAL
jgi:hypothetical protein